MKRSHAFFNFICLTLIIFFLAGTVFEWRKVSVVAKVENAVKAIPLVRVIGNRTENTQPPARSEENNKPKANSTTSTEKGTDEPKEIVRLDLSAPIPNKINLAVPFTSQAPERNWDQPWQDACEEAAVLMLDAYYKEYSLSPLFARDEILKMVAWEEEKSWERSIDIEQIKLLTEKFVLSNQEGFKILNLKFKIVSDPSVEDLKKIVATGHPILVVADGKILPNPYFTDGGPEYHALIIRGYTEDSFITNDPGTWRGENFVYKYSDLMDAIRDWNNGNVKEGKRVVLAADYD